MKGKQHGEGMLVDKYGNERFGIWVEGKLVHWLDIE